jgi:hypothetical protein
MAKTGLAELLYIEQRLSKGVYPLGRALKKVAELDGIKESRRAAMAQQMLNAWQKGEAFGYDEDEELAYERRS